ncbi:hypothetical protein [Mucilaginibacter sp.]|uniref:hypothetical protein n=1 Tax=Mucilaginibacter sp. TaxID=1882438 RepID=UPI003D097037
MLKNILSSKVKGFLISNLIGMAIIGLSKYIIPQEGGGIFIFSEFVIVPILMGMISGWFWQDLRLSSKKLTVYSCYNGLLAIVLSSIFLGEGIICLVIVSPLILCFIVTGAFIGRNMYKRDNNTLNVSVFALLIFIFMGDALSKHEYENMVSDTIIVNAPPNKVWKNVVAFKRIQEPTTYWLFKMGMPSPIESTVEGYYKGAGRKCIFSNGYVFGERIATYEPGQNLTFDVIDQPKDPEIMNHIDIERGQFLLKDNGNGTTTLIGNSWYKLYVFPIWYYDVWAKSITRNVHLRVMQHIKELSEQP